METNSGSVFHMIAEIHEKTMSGSLPSPGRSHTIPTLHNGFIRNPVNFDLDPYCLLLFIRSLPSTNVCINEHTYHFKVIRGPITCVNFSILFSICTNRKFIFLFSIHTHICVCVCVCISIYESACVYIDRQIDGCIN